MAVTQAAEMGLGARDFASPLAKTAVLASRLSAASIRKSFDPHRDIDWSVRIDDSAYHLPPEQLPLWGKD